MIIIIARYINIIAFDHVEKFRYRTQRVAQKFQSHINLSKHVVVHALTV